MQRAVIIIPTYNERDTIGTAIKTVLPIFDEITQSRPGWNMELLVVDDTSPDKTSEIVAEFAKNDRRVHLLLNPKKSGLGGAYLKGMAYARDELQADAVFEFDADLSHDPSKLPLFLDELDKGADMVLGTRYKLGGSIPKDWGLHRKFLSVVGNLTIMCILGDFRYRDWTSGYRCLRTRVFSAVAPLLKGERFTGYTFQIGSLYYALQKKFKVVETVPYNFVDRTVGESKIGPEYMKNTMEFIIKMRLESLLQSRILKFVVVGGLGALIQLVSLQIWRSIVSPLSALDANQQFLLADFLAIETAIISNFVLNNVWTFADVKLKPSQIPLKFLGFNLSSAGSILIQLVVAWVGAHLIGIYDLVKLPVVYYAIDTGLLYVVIGIILGMIWNYFAYTHLIWKTAQKK